jgi:hypothetical protein
VPHGAANGTEPEIEAAIQVDDQRANTPREKRIDRQSNRVLTSDRLVALERATLKRKRASDAARIKAKTWQPTVGTDTKSRDDKKLRAKKLAAPPQQPVKDLRAARPVAQPRSVPARCRIGWWRGYVKSEFYAKARMPDGREYVVRTSLGFRWSKSTPPPKEAPQVAEVHQKLVADLVADGWVVSGVGDEWWALELKLCGDETIDSQKGAVWPPTRTRSA